MQAIASLCSRYLFLIPLLVLLFAPGFRVSVEAAEGDLDPTFGIGGLVSIDFGTTDERGTAVAVQPDGKIVIVGSIAGPQRIALTRLLPNGIPDPTFGVNGRAKPTFPGVIVSDAQAVAIQPDMKIIIGGMIDLTFALVRVNSNGSVDTSFGNGGRVQLGFGFQSLDSVTAIVLQSDRKIVAAGVAFDSFRGRSDFALVRLNPDGSLDPSFGDDGIVTTDLGRFDQIGAAALQSDGKIVVAGSVGDDIVFGLARYHPDGSRDLSFGHLGLVTIDARAANALAIQADGRIIAAGRDFSDAVLARFEADGTLDASFGQGGIVRTDTGQAATSFVDVGLQADGKIVAAGQRFISGPPDHQDFLVARYDENGDLDPAYGVGGTVITNLGLGRARAMTMQPDGRILVVGGPDSSSNAAATVRDVNVVRYEGPPAQTITFFPHGTDIPGTADELTMNGTAPPTQTVMASGINGQSWLSERVLSGGFVAGSTIQVQLPCQGFSASKHVRLATADSAGTTLQTVGVSLVFPQFCLSPSLQTITIPVTGVVGVTQGRLKLTIRSSGGHGSVPVVLGSNTFVRATAFVGVP